MSFIYSRCLLTHILRCSRFSHFLNIFLSFFLSYLLFFPQLDDIQPKIFAPVHTDYDIITNTTGPRLLCMVLTTPENYLTKAVHVKATWGRRCNTLLFISSSEGGLITEYLVPEVVSDLEVREVTGVHGRKNLWPKVKLGLNIIWRDYAGLFDFLVKADDDTFIIVDNLKQLLKTKSSEEPLILGHYQEDRGVGYMSGGSGYVLSQAAVRDFVETGLGGDQPCHLPHPVGQEIEVYPNEDLQMGKCATLLDIKFYSSEISGQSTFLPFPIADLLVPGLRPQWWVDRTKECSTRIQCVSKHLISMHYVTPEMMYAYQYLTTQFIRHI